MPENCTILLVDDEPAVLRYMRLVLQGAGHRILDVNDPEKALQVCAESVHKIDLAVLDSLMPNVTGAQLLVALRNQLPGLPILFVASLPEGKALEDMQTEMILRKPFSAAELCRAVADMLASRPEAQRACV